MPLLSACSMGQSMDNMSVTMLGPNLSPALPSDKTSRSFDDDYAIIDLHDADLFQDSGNKRTAVPVQTVGLSSNVGFDGFEHLLRTSGVKLDLEEMRASKARFQAASEEGDVSKTAPSRQQRLVPGPAQISANLQAEISKLQHNLHTLLRCCSASTAESPDKRMGLACSCCRSELATVTIATGHKAESASIQLCSPCYSLATASGPLSCKDALLLLDVVIRLLEDQVAAPADGVNRERSSWQSLSSNISRNKVSRIVGKLESHLNHDRAKNTLSMALLSVSLNTYSNLHRGMLQVQTCLLSGSGLNNHHLVTGCCDSRRLSKTETVQASGKTKWSQLFEWSNVQDDQTLDMKLEISIWRNNPKCLVGVALVPVAAASGYLSNGPQVFNVYYKPTVEDDLQVSHVPQLESSQPGSRRNSDDEAPQSDKSLLSRLKTFFTTDMFTMDPDDASMEEDPLSSSMVIDSIKGREIKWIVSQGTNEDNDDYPVEEVIPTFQLRHDDGNDIINGEDDVMEWSARPRASSHEHVRASLAPATSLDPLTIAASPLARRSSTVPPSTGSTGSDGTYFVYPIIIPRKFSSSADLLPTSTWDCTLSEETSSFTKAISPRSRQLRDSPVTPPSGSNSGEDISTTLRAQTVGKRRNMLTTVVDSAAGSTSSPDAFHSSGSSSNCEDGIRTIRRALPAQNAQALAKGLAVRRKEHQSEHSDVTETFKRLVLVRQKLYQGLSTSALVSAGDDGTNGVSTSCPVSLCTTPNSHAGDRGDLAEAVEGTSNAGRERHIQFTEEENVEGRRRSREANQAKPDNCPSTEIKLSWTDDGKEVAISVVEARHIYVSSRGKTLPSGIYCKAHLYTKDGRRLKAKSTTVRFSTNPHFNDKLVFNATAQGGEMKIMLWGSHRPVGRHQLLCSAMLVTSSPTSPMARSNESTAAFSGARPRIPTAEPPCPGSGPDLHWYRMTPETSSLPQRGDSTNSPRKLYVPKVLHRFSQRQRRLGERKYSASTGNLAAKL